MPETTENAAAGHRGRAVLVYIVILLGLFLALAGAVLWFLVKSNTAPAAEPQAGVEGITEDEDGGWLVTVKSGESAISVGNRLAEAGLIRTSLSWYLLFKINSEQIKAGTYLIYPPLTQMEIKSLLVSGKQVLIKVTVPEGSTLRKTAQILSAQGVCGEEEFLQAASSPKTLSAYGVPGPSMEGYLFPETYLFPRDFPAGDAVAAMADTFFRRLHELAPESRSMSAEEVYRRVIIASIVEREYRVPEEAPRMAGVFYNRMEIGMALQSCATVEYVITEIQGKPHPEILYYVDTEIKNPYNTYVYPGLPPGPISAPGAVALKAAFFPEASNYLYFVLIDGNAGKHTFSETLDGHNRAKVLYVKGRNASR